MNKTLVIVAGAVSLLVIMLAAQRNTYRRVDVEGTELRMLIAGSGGPAVVFESGLGAQLGYWRRTQQAVSNFTTTLVYDRAGVGGSDASSLPRDGARIAAELNEALRESGIPPPYVLVGHSLGGLHARIYASRYPDTVAALVLVDPTRHDEIDPDSIDDTGYPEMDAMPATMQQAADAVLGTNLPVYLISAMGARGEPWFTPADTDERERFAAARADDLAAHTAWIDSLGNGHLIVTENSGHNVPVEASALVADTIRQAIAAAATPR